MARRSTDAPIQVTFDEALAELFITSGEVQRLRNALRGVSDEALRPLRRMADHLDPRRAPHLSPRTLEAIRTILVRVT